MIAEILIIVAVFVLLVVWIFTLFVLYRKVYGWTDEEKKEIAERKDAIRLKKWRGQSEANKGNFIF